DAYYCSGCLSVPWKGSSLLYRIGQLYRVHVLEEIHSCLDRPGFAPLEVIRLHVARLREQIKLQRELCERLEAVATLFQSAEEVSADTFLQMIEVMTMIENYYTQEQLEYFRKRREGLGPAAEEVAKKGQADWAELLADYRAAMEQGTDPSDPKLQALENRRQALVNAFTGGDAATGQTLKRLWMEQGDKLCAQYGMDPKVMEYLGKVAEAAKGTV